MPTLGVMRETFESEEGSMRVEADFFSVARTMPLVAAEENQYRTKQYAGKVFRPLIPKDVTPWLTAFKAYSVLIKFGPVSHTRSTDLFVLIYH